MFNKTDKPNIQTSLAFVNFRKLIDSGAIHFIGILPGAAKAVNRTNSRLKYHKIHQNQINLMS